METNQNNVPKKSHWVRNIILIIIILGCIAGFIALAQFFDGQRLSQISNFVSSGGKSLLDSRNALPSENYLIKQKVTMPFSIHAPRGVVNAKSNTDFIIVGLPVSKAKAGNQGWQTDWKIIINSQLQTATSHQISGPGMHTSVMTTDFTPENAQYVYYFSLAGLKEGDSIPMRYTAKTLSQSTFHFNENDWIFYDDKNQPAWDVQIGTQDRNTNLPKIDNEATTSAILVKDNGEAGAIIAFPPAELNSGQKGELDKIKQVVGQAGPEISNWWNNEIYNVLTDLPQMPPMKIVLKNNLPGKGYFEEKIDDPNAVSAKPGTGGNNKTPDLAPLPSVNDKNGDGIPDLVPLPGN